MKELPMDIKSVNVKTTSPRGFILGIRKTEYPTREVGILAINPEELEKKRVTGEAIYVRTEDVPKLIEKLREVV